MNTIISLPNENLGSDNKTFYKSNGSAGILSERANWRSLILDAREYRLEIDYRRHTIFQQPILVTLSTAHGKERFSISYSYDNYPYGNMRRILRDMRVELKNLVQRIRNDRKGTYASKMLTLKYKGEEIVLFRYLDGYSNMEGAPKYNRKSFVKALKTAYEEYMRNRVYQQHKPKKDDPRNFIGLEIEFISPYGETTAANELAKSMLAKHITLKDDGSIECSEGEACGDCDYCNDGYYDDCEDRYREECGHEIAILIPQDDLDSFKEPIQEFLDNMKAKVNNSCGIHVHIDIRNRDPKALFTKFCQWQELLYRVNPQSRFNGEYSRAYNRSPVFDERSTDRYVGVNGNPVYDYGTLELRMGAGSTNTTKIFNWIKLLLAVADNKSYWDDKFKPHLSRIALPKPLKQYFRDRIEKLHGKKYSKIKWWNDLRKEQLLLLEDHRKLGSKQGTKSPEKLVANAAYVTVDEPAGYRFTGLSEQLDRFYGNGEQ
jgi:hypothetical protein